MTQRTDAQPRMAYGHEAEVLEVVAKRTNMPSVDDLLKSLRTPVVQSYVSSDDNENKLLMSQESQSAKEERTNNLSVMFNRRCSLSDTEILHRQLSNERLWSTDKRLKTETPYCPSRIASPHRIGSPHRIDSPHRIGSPRRIGSPCRSGSCDNFNFRSLKKGSVAEEVLKELQCDSSLVQSSLDDDKVYPNVDLSDSLNISGTLNDSLEKPVSTGGSTEGAWIDLYHGSQDVNQNAVVMDNSALSVVSASESSSQVAQEIAERPSILKTSRFGMYRDSYNEKVHGSSNKVAKRVRFQDQLSTVEIQTYINKQPSYLSQVPTFQTPISRAMPYKSHYSRSHSQIVGSHHYSDSSPKHESTSVMPTSAVAKSNNASTVHPSDSNELHNLPTKMLHSLPTKTPTDEDINNLWSEIRSYFRESTSKPQNGLRLISVESSGYLTHGTDSKFPNTTQRGTIRTNPVTHLSRNKQATPNRTECSDQVHKTDSRHCVSPVQITFNDSLLRTKQMKTSGMCISYRHLMWY